MSELDEMIDELPEEAKKALAHLDATIDEPQTDETSTDALGD